MVQVLQLMLASVYALVAVSAVAGWLPAACFGTLCLAFPVVSLSQYLELMLSAQIWFILTACNIVLP